MRPVVAALLLLAAAACGDSEERAGTPQATPARTALGATATAPAAAASASPSAPPPAPTPPPTRSPAPDATPSSTPAVSPAPALTATPATAATPVTPGPVGLTPVPRRSRVRAASGAGRIWVDIRYGPKPLRRGARRRGCSSSTPARSSRRWTSRSQVSRRGNEEGLLSVALDPTFEASGAPLALLLRGRRPAPHAALSLHRRSAGLE